MKTLTTYNRSIGSVYHLGEPVLVNEIYGWVISDALYAIIVCSYPQSHMYFNNATKNGLFLWSGGTITYEMVETHKKVIERWSRR